MTDRKSLFRRVFDSIAEGRSRQAQRFIDSYFDSHGPASPKGGTDPFTRR